MWFSGNLRTFSGSVYNVYTSVYRSISDTRPVHDGTNREALAKYCPHVGSVESSLQQIGLAENGVPSGLYCLSMFIMFYHVSE